METLLRCHILWHLIWVCTVCQLSFYGYPDYNGLRETSLPKLIFLPFEKGSPLKGKFAPPWEQILSLKRISFSEGSWWKGNRKSQNLSPLLKVGGKFNRFFLSDRSLKIWNIFWPSLISDPSKFMVIVRLLN